MKNLLLFSLLLAGSMGLKAQFDLFYPYTPKQGVPAQHEQRIRPERATLYALTDPAQLASALWEAPAEGEATRSKELLLTLPHPDGTKSTFRITRYQMITAELQAAYPTYVTAFGWDVDAPHRRIFLDWTGLGFGATISGGAEGRWHVEPLYWQEKEWYQSFYSRDYPRAARDESCGYTPDPELLKELEAFGTSTKSVGDCQLREYDLALACTGEYYAAVGGTEASVVTEMIRAINRVNGVFRSDLAIQLTIINLPTPANGIQLVFSNPNTDPYTNNSGSTMLGENQVTVDNVIGAANYDIGHVFSTGGGGIASLNSPCSSVKAQGVTGLPNPTGDPFYIDFVAHEFGHQFGGNHTFNSTEDNCSTRHGPTAYEPGSGTTIQAYAGICGPTANVQQNTGPYYHAVSLQEISTYMELGGGATCADVVSTSNGAPTVNAGNDYTIPANTPFVLTATGSDPNGDALTYCWEQFDLGPVVAGMPTGNESAGPLFRSLPPTPGPARYFPNLPSVVAGGGSPWEILPFDSRTLNFIVTLRDFGAAGYGCTVQDGVAVTVVNTGSQYAVIAPNGGEVWPSGGTATVSWNEAGTSGNGINCAQVDLVLSTDGGLTFDQVLGTVANNGSATVSVPAITETACRLMVRGNGNIFFDVSDADFSIEQTDYSYNLVNGSANVCNGGGSADFSFNLGSLQGYTGTINYTGMNLPAGTSIVFSPGSTILTTGATQTVTGTLSGLAGLAPGDYAFAVETDDGNSVKTQTYFLEVLPPLATPVLLTPADNGFLPLDAAAFDWEDVPNADAYRIDFYLDAAGTQSAGGLGGLSNSGVNFGSSFADDYAEGDMLFWRVTATDTDCDPPATIVSEIRKFTFGTMVTGPSLLAGNSPAEICVGELSATDFTVSFFNGDLTGPATLSTLASPPGLSVAISPTTLNDGETATVSYSGEENLAPGTYTVTVQADDGTASETIDLEIEVLGAVNVTAPAPGQEILVESIGGCASTGGQVIFVDFEFDAYTGGGTVVEYLLYVNVTGGGSFSPSPVNPGVVNTRGYCTNPDDEYTFRIEAELMDGSFVTSCTGTFGSRTVLPVEWLAFTARAAGKAADLHWLVRQDEFNTGFRVQRSRTATAGWRQIAYVSRSGPNGLATYTHADESVAAGETYFYRLEQEDSDGQTSYSAIRSVTFHATDSNITVRPNPAGDFILLRTGSNVPKQLSYQLYSSSGQRVAEGPLTEDQTRINLAGLPPAIYQILIMNEAGYREIKRIVKR